MIWLDSKTYVDVTRPYLSRQLPLWYRPYYLHTRYQRAEDRTRTVAPQLTDSDRETLVSDWLVVRVVLVYCWRTVVNVVCVFCRY